MIQDSVIFFMLNDLYFSCCMWNSHFLRFWEKCLITRHKYLLESLFMNEIILFEKILFSQNCIIFNNPQIFYMYIVFVICGQCLGAVTVVKLRAINKLRLLIW